MNSEANLSDTSVEAMSMHLMQDLQHELNQGVISLGEASTSLVFRTNITFTLPFSLIALPTAFCMTDWKLVSELKILGQLQGRRRPLRLLHMLTCDCLPL
jgi:hypothetical protein